MAQLANNAQAMRAIFLVSAMATTLNGRRARSRVSQGPSAYITIGLPGLALMAPEQPLESREAWCRFACERNGQSKPDPKRRDRRQSRESARR